MPPDASSSSTEQDPRIYFAAERTLLAWVRTGLAMMGFGFVVARFGLFLREVALVHGGEQPRQHGISLWVGTTLILLGVFVTLGAAVKHYRTIRRLDAGQTLRFGPLSLGIVVAIVLAAIGLATATYLFLGLEMSI